MMHMYFYMVLFAIVGNFHDIRHTNEAWERGQAFWWEICMEDPAVGVWATCCLQVFLLLTALQLEYYNIVRLCWIELKLRQYGFFLIGYNCSEYIFLEVIFLGFGNCFERELCCKFINYNLYLHLNCIVFDSNALLIMLLTVNILSGFTIAVYRWTRFMI